MEKVEGLNKVNGRVEARNSGEVQVKMHGLLMALGWMALTIIGR